MIEKINKILLTVVLVSCCGTCFVMCETASVLFNIGAVCAVICLSSIALFLIILIWSD